MKKALLAALIFIVVGFMLVSGTFAQSDLSSVFADLTQWLGDLGMPEPGGEVVKVSLVSEESSQNLYPGGSATRATAVRNEGTGETYFRLAYAVQYDADSWQKLRFTFAAEGYDQTDWRDITIGGTSYRMKVFTYTSGLPAARTSPPITLTIDMHNTMTSTELARYRADFLQTKVLAIDPTPFAEQGYTQAVDALNLALPLNAGFNPF